MPMYHIRSTSRVDTEVDLPTCMYKLPNIHGQQNRCEDQGHQKWEVDPEVKALQARQDEIMQKLYELEAVVSGLAKTVSTPDADLDALSISQSPYNSALSDPLDLDGLLGQAGDCGTIRDIVINANPAQPPLSLLVLHSMLCRRYSVLSSIHVHSSISAVPPSLLGCFGPLYTNGCRRQRFQLIFTLIWKDVPRVELKFNVPSMCAVEGEGNVARFLYRLLLAPSKDPVLATVMDNWVDTAVFQLAEGGAREQKAVVQALNMALTKDPWLAGPTLSLADILCACWLMQTGTASVVPSNVQKWLKSCENSGHFCHALSLMIN
ncbi:aminoacyl tRNA synthase complex-interacting multifunctional protein 2 [Arapaima gigas]